MFFMGYVGSRPLGDQEPKVVVKNIFHFWRNNSFRFGEPKSHHQARA